MLCRGQSRNNLSCDGKRELAGQYKVTVSRWLRPDGSLPPAGVSLMNSDAKETLPAQYSDPERTTLTRTVPEGGGMVDLALKVARKPRN